MAKEKAEHRNRLVLDLPEEVARRLKLAAARQNRAASRLVIELLDRHLPRSEGPEERRKPQIPYA